MATTLNRTAYSQHQLMVTNWQQHFVFRDEQQQSAEQQQQQQNLLSPILVLRAIDIDQCSCRILLYILITVEV